MALKIALRKESEVPRPTSSGKVNENLVALKAKMAQLSAGMVLEVEVARESSVRATKGLITRAAKELGAKWKHWHSGNNVYAQPARTRRQRSRRGSTKRG